MVNKQKVVIDNKILTRKQLYKQQEKFSRERATLPFEEKIKRLAELQKLAYSWGNKKDVIVWKID